MNFFAWFFFFIKQKIFFMKILEKFRKLDQKKIQNYKKKIHLWNLFFRINIVFKNRKINLYCKIFFWCKKEFHVFRKENPQPLEFIFRIFFMCWEKKKLFSAHEKKFQRVWIFPFWKPPFSKGKNIFYKNLWNFFIKLYNKLL